MKKGKVNATQIGKIAPPVLTDEIETRKELNQIFMQEDIIEHIRSEKEMVNMMNRPYLTIRNCIFSNCHFMDCFFTSAQISDVRFVNSDLSNISFAQSSLHRVSFESCKLVGTNLSESTLNHVTMTDCNNRYINLSMSKMTKVQFTNCDFQSGSMMENRLSGVNFDNCLLVEAEFIRTSLKDIDLRTSRIEGIQVQITDLRGAIVSTAQALELLPLLKMKIED